MTRLIAAAALAASFLPGIAHADIPKFGSTCVKTTSGWTKSVCVSSNGKTLSSKYNWREQLPTSGTHTGCKLSGETIQCSGGSYRTSRGSGAMDPFRVKLAKGKPVSADW